MMEVNVDRFWLELADACTSAERFAPGVSSLTAAALLTAVDVQGDDASRGRSVTNDPRNSSSGKMLRSNSHIPVFLKPDAIVAGLKALGKAMPSSCAIL